MSGGLCIQNVKRVVHSKYTEGCAFTISSGVCILVMQRGVQSKFEGSAFEIIMRGVQSKLSTGECIGWSAFTSALPSSYPWNFGPIQWAGGDVGLKPTAAARPRTHL